MQDFMDNDNMAKSSVDHSTTTSAKKIPEHVKLALNSYFQENAGVTASTVDLFVSDMTRTLLAHANQTASSSLDLGLSFSGTEFEECKKTKLTEKRKLKKLRNISHQSDSAVKPQEEISDTNLNSICNVLSKDFLSKVYNFTSNFEDSDGKACWETVNFLLDASNWQLIYCLTTFNLENIALADNMCTVLLSLLKIALETAVSVCTSEYGEPSNLEDINNIRFLLSRTKSYVFSIDPLLLKRTSTCCRHKAKSNKKRGKYRQSKMVQLELASSGDDSDTNSYSMQHIGQTVRSRRKKHVDKLCHDWDSQHHLLRILSHLPAVSSINTGATSKCLSISLLHTSLLLRKLLTSASLNIAERVEVARKHFEQTSTSLGILLTNQCHLIELSIYLLEETFVCLLAMQPTFSNAALDSSKKIIKKLLNWLANNYGRDPIQNIYYQAENLLLAGEAIQMICIYVVHLAHDMLGSRVNQTCYKRIFHFLSELFSLRQHSLVQCIINGIINLITHIDQNVDDDSKSYLRQLLEQEAINMIETISHTVEQVKLIKSGNSHILTCLKANHQSCLYSNETFAHHDNMYGVSASSDATPSTPVEFPYGEPFSAYTEDTDSDFSDDNVNIYSRCCVAAMSISLLKLLEIRLCKEEDRLSLINRALMRALQRCEGGCCCMSFGPSINLFFSNLPGMSDNTQRETLSVATSFIFSQYGREERVSLCPSCGPQVSKQLTLSTVSSDAESFMSSVSDSDLLALTPAAGKVNSTNLTGFDGLLRIYKNESDLNRINTVGKFITNLVKNGKEPLKIVIFKQVMWPFLTEYFGDSEHVSNVTGANNNRCLPLHVIYVLRMLPMCLRLSKVWPYFLSNGGVNILTRCLLYPQCRSIVVLLWREILSYENSVKENSGSNTSCDLHSYVVKTSFSSIASIETFLNALQVGDLTVTTAPDIGHFEYVSCMWSLTSEIKSREVIISSLGEDWRQNTICNKYMSLAVMVLQLFLHSSRQKQADILGSGCLEPILELYTSCIKLSLILYEEDSSEEYLYPNMLEDHLQRLVSSNVDESILRYLIMALLDIAFVSTAESTFDDRADTLITRLMHQLQFDSSDSNGAWVDTDDSTTDDMATGYDGDLESDSMVNTSAWCENIFQKHTSRDCWIARYPHLSYMGVKLLLEVEAKAGLLVLPLYLLHLLRMCSTSSQCCQAIYGTGILELLVHGYRQHIDSARLSKLFLDTILTLCDQNPLSSRDLLLLLQLLVCDTKNQLSVLNVVHHLIENKYISPSSYLVLPCCRSSKDRSLRPPVLPSPALSSYDTRSKMLWDPIKKVAAFHLPLDTGISKDATKKNVSIAVSFWVNIKSLGGRKTMPKISFGKQRQQRFISYSIADTQNDLNSLVNTFGECKWSGAECFRLFDSSIHLTTVCHDKGSVQLWLEPMYGTILLRKLQKIGNSKVSGSFAICPSLINMASPRAWTHIVISWEERPVSYISKIIMCINGITYHVCFESGIEDDDKALVMSPLRDFASMFFSSSTSGERCMYLGHWCDSKNEVEQKYGASINISAVTLFEWSDCSPSVFTPQICFHLYTQGPEFLPITDNAASSAYARCTNADLLNSKLNANFMQDPMAVKSATLFLSSTVLGWVDFTQTKPAFYQYDSGGTSQTKYPISKTLTVGHEDMAYVLLHTENFDQVLFSIGGVHSFIYLFARTMCDTTANASLKAKSLKLLLILIKDRPKFCRAFVAVNGYILINRLLELSLSNDLLSCILDGALNSSIITCNMRNVWELEETNKCIIQDAELLVAPLVSWRVISNADYRVNDMGFAALLTLLREDHPYQEFNIAQLLAVDLPRRLLLMCQECAIEGVTLSENVCRCIILLTFTLIGSPPKLDIINTIWHFILITHPDTKSFASHSKTTFYYTQKIELQSSNQPSLILENVERRREESFSDDALSESPVSSEERDSLGDGKSLSRGSTYLSNWICEVRSGFLNNLVGTITILPDTQCCEVFGSVINVETLVVLSNHKSNEVRVAVLKLLTASFHRLSQVKSVGLPAQCRYVFQCLCSQLHQYACTRDIAEACFEMLLGQRFQIDSDIRPTDVVGLDEWQKDSCVLVLSLVVQTVVDPALCHNILVLIAQLCDISSSIKDILLANGLVATMCNLLATVVHEKFILHNISDDFLGVSDSLDLDTLIIESRKAIIADIEDILQDVTMTFCSLTNFNRFSQFKDMLLLLANLNDKLENHVEREVMQSINEMHYSLLQNAILQLCRLSQASPAMAEVSGRPMEFVGQARSSVISRPSFVPRPVSSDSDASVMAGGSSKVSQMSALSLARPMTSRRDALQLSSPSKKGVAGSAQGSYARYIKVLNPAIIEHVSVEIQYLLEFSVNVCISSNKSGSQWMSFCSFLLNFLIECNDAILHSNRKSAATPQYYWTQVLRTTATTFRLKLAEIFLNLTDCSRCIEVRSLAINELMSEGRSQKELVELVYKAQLLMAPEQLLLNLTDYIREHGDKVCSVDRSNADKLLCILIESCSLSNIRYFTDETSPEQEASMAEDYNSISRERSITAAVWKKQLRADLLAAIHRMDDVVAETREVAMQITRMVVDTRNRLRKEFLRYLKLGMSDRVKIQKTFQYLKKQLSHSQSPWYNADKEYKFWKLDTTEGPARMRKRFEQCKLTMDKKFLMPSRWTDLDLCMRMDAYDEFCRCSEADSQYEAILYNLHLNEYIVHTSKCIIVSPACDTKGEALIGKECVYFVGETCEVNVEVVSVSWLFENIIDIRLRWFQLKDIALELFLSYGNTFLVSFETSNDRNVFYHKLVDVCQSAGISLSSSSAADVNELENAVNLWSRGKLTNFEYLMHLNRIAGRSFNDLMQYPVFPYILSDYACAILNLNDPHVYRDLSKPVAVQNVDKEEHYREHYAMLEEDYNSASDDGFPKSEPYHYGSHYSNTGTVLHYLIRVLPYTNIFLQYNRNYSGSGMLDVPDRTFHSMETAWRLSSHDSTTDVKELIPEFFYLSEMFQNNTKFNFGNRQTGEVVDDVTLPCWCRNDPRLFVFIHRQALESTIVTANLPKWMDLIFGFKQTGQAAIDTLNVFHPFTYYGKDLTKITDSGQRQAAETQIRNYGQTPKQLFYSVHNQSQQSKKTSLVAGSSSSIQSPLLEVQGLSWGVYVGSPQTSASHSVRVVHSVNTHLRRPTLVTLLTNEVFVLPQRCTLITTYNKHQQVLAAVDNIHIKHLVILSWMWKDGSMRLYDSNKSFRNVSSLSDLTNAGLDSTITCVAATRSVGTGAMCQLFVAGSSGVIQCHQVDSSFESSATDSAPVYLYGHLSSVNVIRACSQFAVVLSGDTRGVSIIWDMNKLTCVSIIDGCEYGSCSDIQISKTLGDIVTLYDNCVLTLHTINGKFVAEYSADAPIKIYCVAISSAPEGKSINCVAGAISTGQIRMWNMIDLSLVRDISLSPVQDEMTGLLRRVSCLVYSEDDQRLYVAQADGTVLILQNVLHAHAATNKPKQVDSRLFVHSLDIYNAA